jgi:hypothetical protein
MPLVGETFGPPPRVLDAPPVTSRMTSILASGGSGTWTPCANVYVTFNLYDKSGRQVESTVGIVANLQPGTKGFAQAIVPLGGWFHEKSSITVRIVKVEVN